MSLPRIARNSLYLQILQHRLLVRISTRQVIRLLCSTLEISLSPNGKIPGHGYSPHNYKPTAPPVLPAGSGYTATIYTNQPREQEIRRLVQLV